MIEANSIYVVHEGKAAYPEVAAIKRHFGNQYSVVESVPSDLQRVDSLERSVAWYMMGFYPRAPKAKMIIHDYRSLSVGRMKRVKDFCKRMFNARPDLRVFQNDEIRRSLGFVEDSRTLYLPMGVPDIFVDNRGPGESCDTDFVYIGSMLAERRCELMIDSFLRRFGASKLFRLYGARQLELEARYADHPNVQFCGSVPQHELIPVLKSARVGVAYFPNHFPHILQTPTKLMEYAALGMRILANEQPQNRATAQDYGVACLWGPADDMFRDVPEDISWPDNSALDADLMRWSSVFGRSGIVQAIAAGLK